MDQLEKVKPKKDFEWYQDNHCVKIRLQIPGTSSKKIDVAVADMVLRVNAVEKKQVVVFDLRHEIDPYSKETRFVYSNGTLEVNLIKKEQGKEWENLLIPDTLSKEEIKQRRQESFQRQESQHQEFLQKRETLRHEYDSKATREQMNQEDRVRDMLKNMKKEELEAAEKFLFKNEDEMNKNAGITQYTQHINAYKVDNNIFSDKDITGYEQQIKEVQGDIPQVRQNTTVNVQFTEKIYPNIATRETHYQEAPMPKMKQNKINQQGSDVDQKNPLWLKDKGDEFFKNKDYISALNAYQQAYKLDNNFIECVANRSSVFMHLFGYDEVIRDCDIVLEYIEQLKEEEKQEKYFMLKLKSKLRKAIAQSWKGTIEPSLDTFKSLQDLCQDKDLKHKIPENIQKQIDDSEQIVKNRAESIKIKKQGDVLYADAQYEKALEHYQQSLEIDNNETAISNISITLLKLKREEESIDYCDKCIEKVNNIMQYAHINPNQKTMGVSNNESVFLLKLYLRKSKGHLNLQQYDEAFQTIKKAIQIDEQHKEARQLYKQIELKINTQKVLKLKEEANQKMRQKEIAEALEIYNECLRLLDTQSEIIEYLAILLNRCACYLHLKKYEDIISSSLRGLKIIRSQKNKIFSWDAKTSSKDVKEKLQQFEVRFLVRRSNAYLQQNLVYNAKNDLQEALKLDPNNEQLKKDLAKIQPQTAN